MSNNYIIIIESGTSYQQIKIIYSCTFFLSTTLGSSIIQLSKSDFRHIAVIYSDLYNTFTNAKPILQKRYAGIGIQQILIHIITDYQGSTFQSLKRLLRNSSAISLGSRSPPQSS